MADNVDVAFLLRGLPGFGHVTPSLAIAEQLKREGIKQAFLTYSNGIDALRPFVREDTLYDVRPPEMTKGRVPWKDMFESTRDIVPIIKELKPKVIVVDGESDSVFLLKQYAKSLVFLTVNHYLEMGFEKYRTYAPILSAMLAVPDRIIVHGVEAPNVEFPGSVFVGPLLRQVDGVYAKQNKITIAMTPGTDRLIFDYSSELGEELAKSGYSVDRIGNNAEGWKLVDNSVEAFKESSLIISHGGATIVSEAYALGKPSLILYNMDEERQRNGRVVERLGYGKTINVNKTRPEDAIKDIKLLLGKGQLPQVISGSVMAAKQVSKLVSS